MLADGTGHAEDAAGRNWRTMICASKLGVGDGAVFESVGGRAIGADGPRDSGAALLRLLRVLPDVVSRADGLHDFLDLVLIRACLVYGAA